MQVALTCFDALHLLQSANDVRVESELFQESIFTRRRCCCCCRDVSPLSDLVGDSFAAYRCMSVGVTSTGWPSLANGPAAKPHHARVGHRQLTDRCSVTRLGNNTKQRGLLRHVLDGRGSRESDTASSQVHTSYLRRRLWNRRRTREW
jgi:hypothetical protein